VINVHERIRIYRDAYTRRVMGTHVRETSARVSGVLADSVKADSPANGRPVFRGELSFERAERSTWRIYYAAASVAESRISLYPGYTLIT